MLSQRSSVAMGCLTIAVIVSGCGVSRQAHDDDVAAVRSDMQAEFARRDTMAMRGLAAAIALNVEQEVRLAALESGMEALGVKMAEIEELAIGAIRYNAPVHFEFDSYDIADAASMATLDRFASVVSRFYSDAMITVEGLADPAGSDEYNQWLGQQRADAVMAYLVQAGVDAGQLRSVSYGSAGNRQVEPGAWGENGMANRRVAFVVDYREGM